MGLSNSNQNTVFLGTFGGKFERRVSAPADGTITRVNKNSKTIHAFQFDQVDGFITKVAYKKTEKWGNFWTIVISDDKNYQIDMPDETFFTMHFINRLISPKLDLSKRVVLKIFADTSDPEIKRNVLLIYQEGDLIPGVFSKEKPGKLPQPKKIKIKGKEVWDLSESFGFLAGILDKQVVPKITAKPVGGEIEDAAEHEEEASAQDLPPPSADDMPEWAK